MIITGFLLIFVVSFAEAEKTREQTHRWFVLVVVFMPMVVVVVVVVVPFVMVMSVVVVVVVMVTVRTVVVVVVVTGRTVVVVVGRFIVHTGACPVPRFVKFSHAGTRVGGGIG